MVAAVTPFEIIVYRLWKKEMHPEWQCYFEEADELLTKTQNGQFHYPDFLCFLSDRAILLSIDDRSAEGRLLRLLVARVLIVYCNRVWNIDLEFEDADECLNKLRNVEYIATIIRCYLLNHHCDKYFPALGWMIADRMEQELKNQQSIARSRIFKTNQYLRPIDGNAFEWSQIDEAAKD